MKFRESGKELSRPEYRAEFGGFKYVATLWAYGWVVELFSGKRCFGRKRVENESEFKSAALDLTIEFLERMLKKANKAKGV